MYVCVYLAIYLLFIQIYDCETFRTTMHHLEV